MEPFTLHFPPKNVLTLQRIQGNERYHPALDENGRVMDASRTGQRVKELAPVPAMPKG